MSNSIQGGSSYLLGPKELDPTITKPSVLFSQRFEKEEKL
jgi:hypothetical protein